ncbi:MAG TPA: 1-deoxy-D-xylulose-5-phosphate reductoisomerase [Candidatus Dormibacteraeota bacterium]|nr:1-deoxy-D-xylulose-5-phosphate reductoisomerase [Candidatus Dormibacteraeota bacterium]
MNFRSVALLGATGSIGQQVIDVVEEFPDRLDLVAVTAGSDVAGLAKIVMRHNQTYAAAAALPPDRSKAPKGIEIGEEAVMQAATHPRADLVVVAISGAASLRPTLAALGADKDVALASKEALVVAGELVMAQAREKGRWILPIDSEHSAIWQCRWGEDLTTISGITLTGSGGPFRKLPLDALADVTIDQALKHPTWKMGPKITIDSATMMNKALELIELHHLFDIPYDQMRVAIHPQSIVHSMVEFVDGTTKAVLGYPDMRVPISITLGYPERLFRHPKSLRLADIKKLEFESPDPRRYPAIELGFEAGKKGKTYPAVLNAANEVAVRLFLDGRLPFDQIVPSVADALEAHDAAPADSVETLLEADAWARNRVGALAV